MSNKRKPKVLTREEVSEFLIEDRNRIKGHITKYEDLTEGVKEEGDKNKEREMYLYFGSRTVKMLELLLKGNETMIKFLEKFEQEDGIESGWEELGEDDVEPAALSESVFGERR
jgi:hypothetical protein